MVGRSSCENDIRNLEQVSGQSRLLTDTVRIMASARISIDMEKGEANKELGKYNTTDTTPQTLEIYVFVWFNIIAWRIDVQGYQL